MKPLPRFVLTLLALIACITALGTLATVLFDALAGVPGNVGPLGAWVVGALLLGQCRILWVLMTTRTSRVTAHLSDTPAAPVSSAQSLHPAP
ncbi:MAG: hypothetical protein EOO27_39695 [Comamonadaceae bacterium]|nr:MAG: hypothetical protein EOO27_39695 [Comamonadaceae bacterium]